ncbi:hypothetical protein GC096_03780 [Paenibacillus sp. LMG 31461]|uniref:Uncharacterized protein n=1 Tax=Paenibacillus plantarum TaxID=2654975 RepID=A0ABX1X4W8_9BACL|nr:hypothetical protein [Paenibacillus plantarum]NOU63166.1 hypothetical protein [Paenibacillus plantarum]
MMVAEIDPDQFSLFPTANAADVKKMRTDLDKYKKIKKNKEDLEKHHDIEVLKHSDVYRKLETLVAKIERAYNLILEQDVKEIIHYRFIEGHDRFETICKFDLCERSIDRKILEGIESIANTFKLWEELH